MKNPFTGEATQTMGDKEQLFDALSAQKFTTSNFNTFANECDNQSLRNDMMSILNEEHTIQYDIYKEASKRGWYPVAPAEQQKIDMAKQKFMNMKNS